MINIVSKAFDRSIKMLSNINLMHNNHKAAKQQVPLNVSDKRHTDVLKKKY